jgi:hypothetical protein
MEVVQTCDFEILALIFTVSQFLSHMEQIALCLVAAKTTAKTRRNHRSLPRQKTHQSMSVK